jgi:hypothetical protein
MGSGAHPRMGGRLTRSLRGTRSLSPRALLTALATSAILAGCGGSSVSATKSTHSLTGTSTRVSGSARAPRRQRQSAAQSLTLEEMHEYDANEGRCHDDGGSVRDVGTLDAYCAFPTSSNDFHLIESSQRTELSGEEE